MRLLTAMGLALLASCGNANGQETEDGDVSGDESAGGGSGSLSGDDERETCTDAGVVSFDLGFDPLIFQTIECDATGKCRAAVWSSQDGVITVACTNTYEVVLTWVSP